MPLPLLCIDSPLARVNRHTLADQTRMELLVQSLDGDAKAADKLNFFGHRGEFRPACEWEGVSCDSIDNVVAIDWDGEVWACGNVSLAMLPSHLEMLNIARDLYNASPVWGTVDTAALPQSLIEMELDGNAFSGSLNLMSLPRQMASLKASDNNFSGSVDLTQLPETLRDLDLSKNSFMGSLCLEKLPESLERLYLYENAFEGSVKLAALPSGLEELDLDKNRLEGKVSFESLPCRMCKLNLSGNRLEPAQRETMPRYVRIR